MAIGCCVGDQAGSCQIASSRPSPQPAQGPLWPRVTSLARLKETGTDNLWMAPVTTSAAGGAASAFHAGQRDTAASCKRVLRECADSWGTRER